MNKKILIFGVLAALMLVAISFATVVSSNTTTTVKKKESPLFGIRTRLAIGERLQDLKETIKARFIGERIFFLPFQWPIRSAYYIRLGSDTFNSEDGSCLTCPMTINCGVSCSKYLTCPAFCDLLTLFRPCKKLD